VLLRRAGDVSDGSAIQNLGGGVAHFQENAIEGAMIGVGGDEAAELIGVAEGRQWAVNQANDLAEFDLGGRTAQTIAALGAANAFDDAGVLRYRWRCPES
jgi:hypothetical protein